MVLWDGSTGVCPKGLDDVNLKETCVDAKLGFWNSCSEQLNVPRQRAAAATNAANEQQDADCTLPASLELQLWQISATISALLLSAPLNHV